MKEKSIIDLIIDLENTKRKLEEIRKPDSEYIKNKVREIYGDKPRNKEADAAKIAELIKLL